MTTPPTLSLWPLRNFVVLWSDDVGAELERALEIRTGKGVVDDHAHVVPMRDLADAADVGDVQHRVGRRLDEEVFGLRRQRRLDQFESRRVDVGEVETELPADALEQSKGSAVGVVADHDVVAGLQARQDGVDRGHARGEGKGGRARFDGGEIPLERHARRILRAAVLEPLVRLAQAILHVGRSLVDRCDDRAGGRIGFLSGVNADGAEACPLVEFHEWPIAAELCRGVRFQETAGEAQPNHAVLDAGDPRRSLASR